MTTGSTQGSKRCKNCCFWQHFTGTIENKVMRKLHGQQQAPARKSHACQLWLRDTGKVDDNDNPVMEGVFPVQELRDSDVVGPEFGQRTGKWHHCNHFRGKVATRVKPPNEVHIGVEHPFFEGLQNIVIPERAEDIQPLDTSPQETAPITVDL